MKKKIRRAPRMEADRHALLGYATVWSDDHHRAHESARKAFRASHTLVERFDLGVTHCSCGAWQAEATDPEPVRSFVEHAEAARAAEEGR